MEPLTVSWRRPSIRFMPEGWAECEGPLVSAGQATGGITLLLALLAACDIPTDAPLWNSTWIVPIQAESIGVADLIPAGVTVSGSVFLVDVTGGTANQTLGSLCGAPCTAVNGQTVPKPAFSGSQSTTVSFPTNVDSVMPGPGVVVAVGLSNGFGFDPLQPAGPAGAKGNLITLIIAPGNDTVAADTVDGLTTPLPPNSALTRSLTLSSGRSFAGPLIVQMVLTSPAGDPTTINTSQRFRLTAPTTSLGVAAAAVRVQNELVSTGLISADFNVGSDLEQHVDSARVDIVTVNPFAVTGTLDVSFTRSGTPVIPVKTIAVGPGTDTATVRLTRTEIRQLLGATADVRIDGLVSSVSGGPVTVLPTSSVGFSSQVFLHLTLGD